jgi:hypothetical protein
MTKRQPRRAFIAAGGGGSSQDAGASSLAALFQACGGSAIRTVGGEDGAPATRGEIIAGLEWLADGAAAGDVLFFIYEGGCTDPPASSPLRDIEGWVQLLVPVDVASAGPIDHSLIYRTLVSPLPKGVRVFLIADAVHDGSLFELKHVVTIQASQQAMATPLPPEVADREYDNREWDVNIGLRRCAFYREPAADVVTIAQGSVAGRGSRRAVGTVACIARAAKRACEESGDSAAVFLAAPLVSICKHASAELVLGGGGAGEHLVLTTSSRPLSALIKTFG